MSKKGQSNETPALEFLAWFNVAPGKSLAANQASHLEDDKIVGGKPATQGQFPFQVVQQSYF